MKQQHKNYNNSNLEFQSLLCPHQATQQVGQVSGFLGFWGRREARAGEAVVKISLIVRDKWYISRLTIAIKPKDVINIMG